MFVRRSSCPLRQAFYCCLCTAFLVAKKMVHPCARLFASLCPRILPLGLAHQLRRPLGRCMIVFITDPNEHRMFLLIWSYVVSNFILGCRMWLTIGLSAGSFPVYAWSSLLECACSRMCSWACALFLRAPAPFNFSGPLSVRPAALVRDLSSGYQAGYDRWSNHALFYLRFGLSLCVQVWDPSLHL